MDAVDGLVLAAHEVVANAVEHGGVREDAIVVDVRAHPGRLTVTVRHPGPPFPVPDGGAASPGAERGRGLELARRLVDDLEHRVGPAGHTWHLTVRRVAPGWSSADAVRTL